MDILKTVQKLKGRPFSRKEMEGLGLTGNHIQELLKTGQIDRVSRGVYQIPGENLADEEIFQAVSIRIKGRSAICLLSALAYYNLTDAIPKKTWLLTDSAKRTIHKDIRLFRTRNPNWKIGITQAEGFAITSIERTLVDSLVQRSLLGSNQAISALKKAVAENKATLSKIVAMAERLGVEHRIHPYIESLT